MRPGFAIHDFVVSAARADGCRRQINFGQDFVWCQHVLADGINFRQREEFRSWHYSLAGGANNLKFCLERDQRRRCVGGMHDVAGTSAEHGVELVLTHN